jgi:hypothetical protein
MSIKEQVTQELEHLSEAELEQVDEFLQFLKFRARVRAIPADEADLAALYGEFAGEDREMADEGMAEYARGLIREDQR